MQERNYQFSFRVYDSIAEMEEQDALLLRQAQQATELSYAPYSNFHVGAVARLENGKAVSGANQENASYPVGICAEQVLLSSAATLYPGVPVDTIAVSYRGPAVKSDHPVAPCGICRQTFCEYETRTGRHIRLILGGLEGRIYVIPAASMLLPFSFTGDELGG